MKAEKILRFIMQLTLWFLVTAVLPLSRLFAQDNFAPDRPGIANVPSTVPARYFQIETGVDYFRSEKAKIAFLPTALARVGVTRNFELRFGGNIARVDSLTGENDQSIHVDQLLFGFKTLLWKERGALPAAAVQTEIALPDVRNMFRNRFNPGASIVLLMENNLSPLFSVNYNFGVIWDELPNRFSEVYAVCLEVQVSTSTSFFVEQSSTFCSWDKDKLWFDVGATWLVKPSRQLDVSFGLNANSVTADIFLSAGYSVRFGTRH